MPITSRPARARGRAATPPAAPNPTITTSVFLRLVAMIAAAARKHRVVIGGFQNWLGFGVHALIVRGHAHANAGIADQFPTDEVRIPTVIGIGKRAFDRMCTEEIEE